MFHVWTFQEALVERLGNIWKCFWLLVLAHPNPAAWKASGVSILGTDCTSSLAWKAKERYVASSWVLKKNLASFFVYLVMCFVWYLFLFVCVFCCCCFFFFWCQSCQSSVLLCCLFFSKRCFFSQKEHVWGWA